MSASNHIFARHDANWHRDWDRNRDHFWHGHRCRFVNGEWFIFDLGFFPGYPYGYPYDYYAYDYYPYDYEDYYAGVDPNYYGYDASTDPYSVSTVRAVQSQLARQGYYHGVIDGVYGPQTRAALTRYQSNHGLQVTGSLTMDTLRSLGLPQATSS